VNITVDDLKKLSPAKKALVVAGVCLLLGYFYYMFFLQDMIARQVSLRTKSSDMEGQIAQKEKVAAQIGKYKKEVGELHESLKIALQKLPNDKEIAGLLASVVLAGKTAGIHFLLFEPKPPPPAPPAQAQAAAKKNPKGVVAKPAEPQKFYEEIPIDVKLSGAFHKTVSFFASVAKLPRIVNVEDINIADAKHQKDGGMTITTTCRMKTYMFIDKGKK
jgi:type IV pilus assembly protein PilO